MIIFDRFCAKLPFATKCRHRYHILEDHIKLVNYMYILLVFIFYAAIWNTKKLRKSYQEKSTQVFHKGDCIKHRLCAGTFYSTISYSSYRLLLLFELFNQWYGVDNCVEISHELSSISVIPFTILLYTPQNGFLNSFMSVYLSKKRKNWL